MLLKGKFSSNPESFVLESTVAEVVDIVQYQAELMGNKVSL